MKIVLEGKTVEIDESTLKKLLCKGECSGEGVTEDMEGSTQEEWEDLDYVIVRSAQAGVFAGYLYERDREEVTLYQARRIWYWSGAATLSELALHGPKKPDECKFPEPLPKIEVMGVCEVIPCSQKGRKNIQNVPEWKA